MKLRANNQINKSPLKIALFVMHAFSLAYSAAAIAAGETVSIGSKAGDQNAYASTTWSSLSADARYTALVAGTNYRKVFFYMTAMQSSQSSL